MTAREEIRQLHHEILASKKRLAELRRAQPPTPVPDYEFVTANGPLRLSQLFGEHSDLLVIHNMGRECAYCTLWADGFNGFIPELVSRTGFALVSADPIDVAAPFAESRGWRFPVLSDPSRDFHADAGMLDEDRDVYPGISSFHRDSQGNLFRIASAPLGEGDDFCPIWHMLDLLKDGWAGWEPKYRL